MSSASQQSETRAQRAARRAAAAQLESYPIAAAASYAARRSSDESSSDSSRTNRRYTRSSSARIAASAAPSGSALGEATNQNSGKRTHREASAETSRKKARASQNDPLPSVPTPLDTSAPTVTPASAAVARQIYFGDSSSVQSDATILPEGVVNIFPSKKHSPVVCKCPADINANTVAAFEHMAHYGREYGEILRSKEERQISDAATFLQPPTRESSSSHTDSTDDDDSRPGTPRPGTILRYRPRALNMQDPRSMESTEPLYRQPFITPRMRAILVNWLVEVAQEYSISQDAYQLAITLLDMVLAKGPTQQELDEWDEEGGLPDRFLVTRREFQALGCACLWIASKMEDKTPPLQEELVFISDHSFTSYKLRELEQKVSKTLAFRLHRVTPLHFVNEYLRASHACPVWSCKFDHPVLRQVVQYLLELSRLSYELSFCKPSLVTAAAVFLGRATVGICETHPERKVDAKGYWTKTLQYHTKYSVEDLKDTVLLMYKYQLRAEGSSTASAFNKYRKREYEFASLKTVLRVEDLGLDSEVNHEDMQVDEQQRLL